MPPASTILGAFELDMASTLAERICKYLVVFGAKWPRAHTSNTGCNTAHRILESFGAMNAASRDNIAFLTDGCVVFKLLTGLMREAWGWFQSAFVAFIIRNPQALTIFTTLDVDGAFLLANLTRKNFIGVELVEITAV